MSGRIKAPVKATLPAMARGAQKAKNRVTFKGGEAQDDLDQELMEINSKVSEAKINAQIPPMQNFHDHDDSIYHTKSPSVYEDIASGPKSA